MCNGCEEHPMEEYYVQKFGNKRIVQIVGWSDKEALVYDLKMELKYPMTWDVFFMHHEKLNPAEINVDNYQGANLDLKDE